MSHTSLRGFAALLVVWYHLQFGAPYLLPFETATSFFKRGYLWVDLFFILSGFVISYSAGADRIQPYSRVEIHNFFITRVARIYPLHIFCLLLLVLEKLSENIIKQAIGHHSSNQAILSGDSLHNLLEQIFLLNAWGITGIVGWNIPSWSISAELVAYALFPIVVWLTTISRNWTQLLLVSAALTFYLWVGMGTGNLDIVKGAAIFRCLAGFSLGIILYFHRGIFEHLSFAALSLIQIGGVILAGLTLARGWNDTIAIPAFFLIIAATSSDRGIIARALSVPPFVRIGEISYSIYLSHFIVLGVVHQFCIRIPKYTHIDFAMARSIELVLSLICIIAASELTYRWIEQPARRALLKRFKRQQ